MRDHDVRTLTASELKHTERELKASLALARPGSPARVPILAHLNAIDAEQARREPVLHLCSCGFGTDDHDWFGSHATEHPGHHRLNP